MLDFQGMYMIRSQKKIWPRLEVGVVTEIWVNMLGSSQNPTIFLLMIPTPKSIVHGKFIARDEQSRRKNHPPFSEVLTSWCTRFQSSHGDFKETREKVKGKQTDRVNEGFDSGKKYEALNKCTAKPSILAFQLLVLWKSIYFLACLFRNSRGWVGGGEAINQLNMCIFWLLGGKHEQYIYLDVVKQNKTLNFESILLRG